MDVYTVAPWGGLYMARPTPGREQFHYLESWLLPPLGLRVSVFHWNPGFERDQDFYVDVGEITVEDDLWRTEDHYIDLVVRTGASTEVVDVDELLEAHRIGLLSPETAEQAIRRSMAAVAGLAGHRHDLNAWLSGSGMELTWG